MYQCPKLSQLVCLELARSRKAEKPNRLAEAMYKKL